MAARKSVSTMFRSTKPVARDFWTGHILIALTACIVVASNFNYPSACELVGLDKEGGKFLGLIMEPESCTRPQRINQSCEIYTCLLLQRSPAAVVLIFTGSLRDAFDHFPHLQSSNSNRSLNQAGLCSFSFSLPLNCKYQRWVAYSYVGLADQWAQLLFLHNGQVRLLWVWPWPVKYGWLWSTTHAFTTSICISVMQKQVINCSSSNTMVIVVVVLL